MEDDATRTKPEALTPAPKIAPAVIEDAKPKPVDPKYDEAFFRDLYQVEDSDSGQAVAATSCEDAFVEPQLHALASDDTDAEDTG